MYEIFLTLHLIGVVVGAGGALVGDALFFGAVRDHHIKQPELNLLKITGRLVWIGLAVLVISGFIMLALSDFAFLHDAGFQVKMIIIGIIAINGIVLHKIHMPFLSKMVKVKNIDKDLERNYGDWRSFKLMFISGAISAVSWFTVIVLGSLRNIDLPFGTIATIYLVALALALLVGQFIVYHMFPKHKTLKTKKHSVQRGIFPYLITLTLVALISFSSLNPLLKENVSAGNRVDTSLSLTPKSELVWDDRSHVSYAPLVPEPSDYDEQRIFEVKLEVLENVCSLDPENNISFDTWGYRVEGDSEIYCGTPGPVLRGRVGDIARITLTNLPGNVHPHNIDFHAVTGQGGGAHDLIVVPGETASIDVRLLYPGAFMYHCAYGDVPVHISHGMYGMFIVDPEEPLQEVDHEWSISQSEWYVGEPDENGLVDIDREKLFDEEPNIITFNGRKDALLGENALNMNVGERARIYFVNQGLNLTSNFHPIGSHWDIVYPEGATHPANKVIHGSQSTSVVAGGGTVVELKALVPSSVILVDHALMRTFSKGAKGIINIYGDENPELYSINELPEVSNQETSENIEGHDQNTTTAEVVQVTIPKGSAAPAMADRAYLPRNVVIEKGTTVTWTNEDNVRHTVTSGTTNGKLKNPDGIFDSGFVKKGQTFSYTFNEVGEFPYYCAPHPWATGTVVVEE